MLMRKIFTFILTLIALMGLGMTAHADNTETLLTTITATGKTTYSQSVEGVVTVTPANIEYYDNTYGWLWDGTITVEPMEGYTITKCRFIQNDKTPLDDDLAPFSIVMSMGNIYPCSVITSAGQKGGGMMDGVTSIEVYGYVTPTTYSVNLSGGANATASGGSTSQSGLSGAMNTVTYTANSGYYFENFNEIESNGVTCKKTDDATVTVSGTPTADVTITVPDAVSENGEGSTAGVENVQSENVQGAKAIKYIRDNHVYIEKNGEIFTLTGSKVK